MALLKRFDVHQWKAMIDGRIWQLNLLLCDLHFTSYSHHATSRVYKSVNPNKRMKLATHYGGGEHTHYKMLKISLKRLGLSSYLLAIPHYSSSRTLPLFSLHSPLSTFFFSTFVVIWILSFLTHASIELIIVTKSSKLINLTATINAFEIDCVLFVHVVKIGESQLFQREFHSSRDNIVQFLT